jgi:hypothetical protein
MPLTHHIETVTDETVRVYVQSIDSRSALDCFGHEVTLTVYGHGLDDEPVLLSLNSDVVRKLNALLSEGLESMLTSNVPKDVDLQVIMQRPE